MAKDLLEGGRKGGKGSTVMGGPKKVVVTKRSMKKKR
jgi:hypothetical protein